MRAEEWVAVGWYQLAATTSCVTLQLDGTRQTPSFPSAARQKVPQIQPANGTTKVQNPVALRSLCGRSASLPRADVSTMASTERILDAQQPKSVPPETLRSNRRTRWEL